MNSSLIITPPENYSIEAEIIVTILAEAADGSDFNYIMQRLLVVSLVIIIPTIILHFPGFCQMLCQSLNSFFPTAGHLGFKADCYITLFYHC